MIFFFNLTFMLLKAFGLGALAASPPGPVNFDIIHHATSLEKPRAYGVAFGAALADGLIFLTLALLFPLVGGKLPHPPNYVWFLSALAFGGIGFYRLWTWYRGQAKQRPIKSRLNQQGGGLAKGLTYVTISPGVYAYWGLVLLAFGGPLTRPEYASIALCISIGAFAYWSFFIHFIDKLNAVFTRLSQVAQAAVPLLFICFGIFSLFKFFAGRMT